MIDGPDTDAAAPTDAGVTIVSLRADQLDLIEPLWRSLLDHIRELGSVVPIVPHHDSWPRRRANYQELLADGESFALGAFRGAALIGYAMVHVAGPDPVWLTGRRYVELASLSVAPDERGRGLGTRLLDEVERRLLELGLHELVIGVDSVNHDARRFYERRGFTTGYSLMHGRLDTAPRPHPGDGSEGSPETAAHGEA